VLGLVVTLVLVLALPPIQLTLARAFFGDLDGADIELGFLWVGPRGVALEGLRVEAPGFVISVEAADVDLAFWSSLLGLQVDIESLDVRGGAARIDRAAMIAAAAVPADAAAAEAAAPAPFTGLAASLRLPEWLTVRSMAAAGDVQLLTARGDIDLSGPWELTLAALEADSRATARFAATLDSRWAGEVLATILVAASLTAAIDARAQIVDLDADADIAPAGGGERGVRAAASFAFGGDGERYTLDLDSRAGARIVHAEAGLAADGDFAGSWEVNVTPGVVAAFARGRSAADLSGTSTGTFSTDRANRRISIQADARGRGSGWDAFDPRLTDLGEIELDLALAASLEPNAVDAENIALVIASATRGEMLRVTALQRLRFETDSWLVDPATWGEPALRIQANALPLQWLRGFSPGANLEGGEFSGAVDFIRDAELSTRIVVTEPLRAVDIELEPVGNVEIPAIDLTLVPRATLANGALEAEIEELTMTAATGFQLQFQGRGTTSRTDWPVADLEGTVSAHLPRLQRIIPQLDRVRGTTRMRFDFSTMILTIATAAIGADSADGRELLAADLSSQEPLRLRVPNFVADWDAFAPQTLTLKLDRMPIDWLSPYIPELRFRGGDVSGLLELAGGAGQGVRLTVDEPVVIADFLPIFRGREARQMMTATVRPRLSLTNAASSFALEDLRMETPGGDVLTGEIDVEAAAGAETVAISVALDGDFRSLAARYGTGFSALRFRHRAALEPASRRFTVEELTLDAVDASGTGFLGLAALRPFFIMAEPFGVGVDGGSPDILRVAVTPLRLEQVVPRLFGFDLEGVLPEGEFFGRAESDGRLVLAADAPLAFRDVTVRWGDATLLDRVTMGVQYEIAYSSGGLEARSVDLTATDLTGNRLLHATSEALVPLDSDRLLERAHATLEANLAPLSTQPIFRDVPPFNAGTLAASLEFDRGAEAELAFELMLADAVASDRGPLPNLDVRFDATGVLGERVRFELPVHFESAEQGASDLRLAGTSVFDAEGVRNFEATLSGQRIVMSDFDRLSGVFAPREAPAPEAATEGAALAEAAEQTGLVSAETRSAIQRLRAERDSVPAWTDRLRGTASVEVGSVVYPSLAIEALRGRLEIAPERAALTNLRASLAGATIGADAVIEFSATEPKPYTLGFNADVANLDLGRIFRAVAPDAMPTTEGIFDLRATLAGSGRNPLDLAASSLGEIRLEGRDGIFRGLAEYEGTGSTASRVIGILTFSKELRAIGRILDRLGELRFEEAEFVLERTGADRLELENLLVRGPELRVRASGSLERSGPEQPVVLSPLELSAEIAARGDVGILFDGMELLEETTDAAGYRALTRPIAIHGTPAAPDAEEFWALLEQGAENAGGSFGVALRALNRQLETGAAPE
jgi:hypothetical protein